VAVGLVLDGRYRLDKAIGHGGMATVYRAWDTTLGRDVALKLFPPAPDADDALRFDAEIGFLAQLSHPNLVALYDGASAPVGNHLPRSYIVMELVAGPTLADLLAGGPLPAGRVTRIGHQLADALAYVHAAQVVHRDVKPANVLGVHDAPDGDATRTAVKLADFGIARLISADRVTATGTTLGTATYLSPEQAAGEAVGPPTDVYALGLVLLECLTGRKAFTGTFAEVAAARLTTAPPIPDEVGAAWGGLLRDMTRRDPAERVTMADAAARLSLLDDAEGSVTVELGTSPQATRRIPIVPGIIADPGPGAGGGAAGAGAGVGRGLTRWRPVALVLAGVLAAVLALAWFLGPTAAEETEAPTSVPIDGPLGAALDDLVRSVQP
jgi:serine/threonine protein kinase